MRVSGIPASVSTPLANLMGLSPVPPRKAPGFTLKRGKTVIVRVYRDSAAKGKAPGHIESLVTAIKPAVEATAKDDLETTIKANVKHVVQALRSSRPILKAKVDSGDVQVIGGYYSLDTGSVSFLDEK